VFTRLARKARRNKNAASASCVWRSGKWRAHYCGRDRSVTAGFLSQSMLTAPRLFSRWPKTVYFLQGWQNLIARGSRFRDRVARHARVVIHVVRSLRADPDYVISVDVIFFALRRQQSSFSTTRLKQTVSVKASPARPGSSVHNLVFIVACGRCCVQHPLSLPTQQLDRSRIMLTVFPAYLFWRSQKTPNVEHPTPILNEKTIRVHAWAKTRRE